MTGYSHGIVFHLPWNIKQNFIKKKRYQKNWNLDDKKSSHSVKKREKFKIKWQKILKTEKINKLVKKSLKI